MREGLVQQPDKGPASPESGSRVLLVLCLLLVALVALFYVAKPLIDRRIEMNMRELCQKEYDSARTWADTDRIDRRIVRLGRRSKPLTCRGYRETVGPSAK